MTQRSNSRIAAVVLAAGNSYRMGKAKQLLPLGNSTVLERTLKNLQDSTVDEFILVLGASAEAIQKQLTVSRNLKTVLNPDLGGGMSSSLRKGLSAINPDIAAALIVLADQPFVQPVTFNQIIEAYRRSEARIVIPIHNGSRGNPVLLDRSIFPEVMALKGDTGVRAIFEQHTEEIAKVEVADPGILLDIDNKEDYERLRILEPGN
ncbi:MAG TPA: molybdenum cofactor cytidylyltransferase [Edaphobacter sp.]|jgi:molybdenum cofactor cytidylyltransferase|nr:molybdenum cofactor cytidylyltransferase [Edaphobacter sp.]